MLHGLPLGLPHSMALLLWVLVKDFREEGGVEVLPFVLTEISTFSNHQSQQQKPCNRNSRQKAPPQSMVVARMQV